MDEEPKEKECTAQAGACSAPARMAVDTVNGKALMTKVYYDDREAPKKAAALCRAHGIEMMTGLITTLVEET